MQCSNCGAEFDEGIFCPECGTRYHAENVIALSEADLIPNNKTSIQVGNQDENTTVNRSACNDIQIESSVLIKPPFYVQMWFVSIVFWVGSAFCIGIPVSVALFILRQVKYPQLRRNGWISGGVQIGILVLILIMALL